jgi:hypothetical protein
MLSGHRSAWRRRGRSTRAARIAVPLAIPMALGLTLGIILAVSGGNATTISQSALGSCASPSASASAAAAAPAATPSPCASGSATASPTAGAPALDFNGFGRGGADLAGADAVDAAGNPVNLNQTAAQAANSMNCTLFVPANPLSAQGLATPWQLADGCSEANPNLQAFVEATILAPDGQVQVYDPLVITEGTTPAAPPAVPAIQPGSQVIINIGFNGNTLVLEGQGAVQGRCIDAFNNSVISQTSACNAAAFFADANRQIAQGTLKVPPAGMGNDGQPCDITRSFSLIDQDQSDNTVTEYLLNGNGQTAQNSAANKNAMGGATTIANGSDNGLLDLFVDPALGCKPFEGTSITEPNGVSGSQALDELSARQNPAKVTALLPVNDPQLLVGGQFSVGKTDAYRALEDQPPLQLGFGFGRGGSGRIGFGRGMSADVGMAGGANSQASMTSSNSLNQNAAAYCQNMVNIAPARLKLDMAMEANFTSPVPAVGNNLATFMGARLSASFVNLKCANFGLTNPVTLTLDGNGVATAVTYNTAQQTAKVPGGTVGGAYDQKVPAGRSGHKENATGM